MVNETGSGKPAMAGVRSSTEVRFGPDPRISIQARGRQPAALQRPDTRQHLTACPQPSKEKAQLAIRRHGAIMFPIRFREGERMDQERFRDWFTRVDDLTPAQRQEVSAALSGRPQGEDALAAIELGVDDERRCPHCASAGAVSRGKARGLRRYRCKACGKTFGALTGTALSGLHYKERWLSFGEALAEGETIVESAERCGIAPSTAFRWRHRFLKAVRQAPDRLRGIVEADETFVLESRKGERKLDRKPRRRGGKARKRGLSREQVPVLVAADRTGETLSCTLPILNAKSVTEALKPVLARDALLVSDANRCYPPVAAALDIPHETINRSAGERVRGAVHIQTVNSRHSPDQGLPATLPGHRHQVSRQLPAVVSSHRTRRPPAPESLPDRSHGKTMPTFCELSQRKRLHQRRRPHTAMTYWGFLQCIRTSRSGHLSNFRASGINAARTSPTSPCPPPPKAEGERRRRRPYPLLRPQAKLAERAPGV